MKRLIFIPLLILSITLSAQFTKSGGTFLRMGNTFVTEIVPAVDYDDDVDTYISGLLTTLSDDQLTKINTFVVALKDSLNIATLSEYFDVIYILGNETEEAALRNFVERDHDATAINEPTFVALEGYNGDLTGTKYVSTDYNPTADSVNFGRNDASIGYYCRKDTSATIYDVSGNTTGITINARSGAGNFVARLNDVTSEGYAVANSLGLSVICRPDQNTKSYYRNTTDLGDKTTASAAVANNEILLLKLGAVYSRRQLSFFFIGKSLTAAEVSDIFTCFEAYMDSNGKGVI